MRELTPAGLGAVGVVEVVGPGALEFVRRVFSLPRIPADRIALARLRVADLVLDEALLVAPGAERVELHLHGNPFVVGEVLRALEAAGAHASTSAGGARHLLASARTEEGARILLDQSEGALGRELDGLLALRDPRALQGGVRALLERSRVADFALRARLVVIAGPVNAGKSTLFNVLTGSERVVAADQEGTTRDAIREPTAFGPYPVELVDTAGTRALSSDDEAARLERMAQERARAWCARADLVLALDPHGIERAATGGADATGARRVRLPSQVDRWPASRVPPEGISALHDPVGARGRVESSFRAAFHLPERAWEPGRGVLLDRSWWERIDPDRFGTDAELRSELRAIQRAHSAAVEGFEVPG